MHKKHKVIDWIELNLVFPSKAGKELYKKPVRLMEYQKDILWELFSPEGKLLKNYLFISSCRKIGKSVFAGFLLNYFQFGRESRGAEFPILASSFEQSKIIYDLYAETAILSFGKEDFIYKKESLRDKRFNSKTFIASTKASSNYGGQSTVILIDELSRHENNEAIESLSSGLMLSKNPLEIYLTNPPEKIGHFSEGFLKTARAELKKKKSNWCVRIFEGKNDTLEIDDEKNWALANPAIREGKLIKVNLNKYRIEAAKAKHSQDLALSFKRNYLGIWARAEASEWINAKNFKVLERKDDRYGRVAFGLDLSISRDRTALTLCEELPDNKGYFFKTFHYLPETALPKMRPAKRKQVERWIEDGWINLQSSPVIDQQSILSDIEQLYKKSESVENFYMDLASGGLQFSKEVSELGVEAEAMNCYPRILTPLINELERIDNAGEFCFDGSPVVVDDFRNCLLTSKQSRNYKSVMRASVEDSIDSVISSLFSVKHWQEKGNEPIMDVYYG